MARLLVLWLLAERPLSGYEIKRALTDHGMRFWFGLEDGSIYSVLKTLVKHEWATAVAADDVDSRSATRYAITPAGRDQYRLLLAESALRLPEIGQPVDVLLAADGDIPAASVSEGLVDRRELLAERAAELGNRRRTAPANAIVERHLALTRAELDWLDRHLAVEPAAARPPSDTSPTRRQRSTT